MPNLSSIITSMKKKIPVLPLTLQLIIVKSVYPSYDPSNNIYLIGFWIYYPILCLICGGWEAVHAYIDYNKVYPHRTKKERVCYTILSTFISIKICYNSIVT